MSIFRYEAVDQDGNRVKGIEEGESIRQVRTQLYTRGLVSIWIKNADTDSISLLRRKRIRHDDLVLVTQQLSVLLQSGIPLIDALEVVSRQINDEKFCQVILGVREKVNEGQTLHGALKQYPYIFDRVYCGMVESGEQTGRLDIALQALAENAHSVQAIRQQVSTALIYPCILVFTSILVIAYLITSIFPKIIEQFITMGQTLPPMTQILLDCANFVRNNGILLIAILLLSIFAVKKSLGQPKIRKRWHQFLLKLPWIGHLIKQFANVRFTHTLSMCSSCGVSLLQGIDISSEVISNDALRESLRSVGVTVREGGSLSEALQQHGAADPMIVSLIASGEQSGKLGEMLKCAAMQQENRLKLLINTALKIFEPALILFMAGAILFIIMATLMPILELNNMIN